ncbi:hypothetical protein BH11VER1_BH11VER1_14010 [soil metagenome]
MTARPPSFHRSPRAYTLIELLVVVTIIAILAVLVTSGWKMFRGAATSAACTNNLRQLSAAVTLYSEDHNGCFPPYVEIGKNGQRKWYFGNETTPEGTAEGDRDLDRNAGPLYPYIEAVGKIEVCQGFNYGNAVWKPKFKGASYGYGYNWNLGGRFGGMPMNVAQLRSSSSVLLFGDCGQVNTFQKPASKKNPKIEEFYIIDQNEKTVHFRHNGRANILFVDGHVESFKPYPGTVDTRVKGEIVGRITKRGSMEYIK